MKSGPVRITNLLGLAVLGLLHEQPMHPHAVAAELRERGLDRSFKLTTGSLYDVVRALERAGWITEVETVQVGARPPRTIYAPTEDGRAAFIHWIDELVREPGEEFPKFLSAVTYLGALGPTRATAALRERAQALRMAIDQIRVDHRQALEKLAAEDKPRLFVLEAEYALWMAEAELAWVVHTAQEIVDGTLPWPQGESVQGHPTDQVTQPRQHPADAHGPGARA
jgi:DNA-binding PadR family transcriptional regulator